MIKSVGGGVQQLLSPAAVLNAGPVLMRYHPVKGHRQPVDGLAQPTPALLYRII